MPRLPNISKYCVVVPLGGVGVVEAVEHADALHRRLLHAVDDDRLRQAGGLEDGRRDVDDVVELVRTSPLRRDAVRPVDDRAVAGAAPVGGDLLGPLVGRVHGVRPADRVVVVGVGAAELVDGARAGTPASRARPAPLKLIISLKVPLSVPSAEAPLSPMM